MVQVYRDSMRKARAQMELGLERDAKNSKKEFCKDISQKRQAK